MIDASTQQEGAVQVGERGSNDTATTTGKTKKKTRADDDGGDVPADRFLVLPVCLRNIVRYALTINTIFLAR